MLSGLNLSGAVQYLRNPSNYFQQQVIEIKALAFDATQPAYCNA
jgi:hypothetical protein